MKNNQLIQQALSVVGNPRQHYTAHELNLLIRASVSTDDTTIIDPAGEAEIQQSLADNIKKFVDDESKTTLLLPIEIRDNHFVGVSIKKVNKKYVVSYFDPSGAPIRPEWSIMNTIISALGEKPNIDLLVNKTRLQSYVEQDYSAVTNHHCGAFTADFLIGVANDTRKIDAEGRLVTREDKAALAITHPQDLDEDQSNLHGIELRKRHVSTLNSKMKSPASTTIEDVLESSPSISTLRRNSSKSASSARSDSSKSTGSRYQTLLNLLPDSDKVAYFPVQRFLDKIGKGTRRNGLLDGDVLLQDEIVSVVGQLRTKHNHARHNENSVRSEAKYNTIVGAVLVKFETSIENRIDALVKVLDTKKFKKYKKQLTEALGIKLGSTATDLKADDVFKGKIIQENFVEEILKAQPEILKEYQRLLHQETITIIPIEREVGASSESQDQTMSKDIETISEVVKANYQRLFDEGYSLNTQINELDIKGKLLGCLDKIDWDGDKFADKKILKEEVDKMRGEIEKGNICNIAQLRKYKVPGAWDKTKIEFKAVGFIKESMMATLELSEEFLRDLTLSTRLEFVSKEVRNIEKNYFIPGSRDWDDKKLKTDIRMIRGHSESELLDKMTIEDSDYSRDKRSVKKAYVLIVSSNEACSACTNVIPEIQSKAAVQLGINDSSIVQLLYFPIAEHENGKLCIQKLAPDRYELDSSEATEVPVVLFDAALPNTPSQTPPAAQKTESFAQRVSGFFSNSRRHTLPTNQSTPPANNSISSAVSQLPGVSPQSDANRANKLTSGSRVGATKK